MEIVKVELKNITDREFYCPVNDYIICLIPETQSDGTPYLGAYLTRKGDGLLRGFGFRSENSYALNYEAYLLEILKCIEQEIELYDNFFDEHIIRNM